MYVVIPPVETMVAWVRSWCVPISPRHRDRAPNVGRERAGPGPQPGARGPGDDANPSAHQRRVALLALRLEELTERHQTRQIGERLLGLAWDVGAEKPAIGLSALE